MAVRGYRDGKGRQRYLVEFQQRGVRKLERLPPDTTHAQAKERETQLRRELYDGATLGHRPALLLSEVIQQWLDTKPHRNHRTLVNNANALARFVAGKSLEEAPLAATEAERYWTSKSQPSRKNTKTNAYALSARSTDMPNGRKDTTTGSDLARATINRRLAILKAACHWAFDQGMIEQNLSARIKLRREENQREVYLTKGQINSLAKSAPTEATAGAIILAAYTGLRASELLAMKPTNMAAGTLRVSHSKNGRPRMVPVPKPALPYLRHLPLGLSYDQLRHGFDAAKEAAGLGPEVTFHCLRHTYASWMINAGVDLLTLSKLLGHSTVAVTQRYAHLYDSTLREAVARLK